MQVSEFGALEAPTSATSQCSNVVIHIYRVLLHIRVFIAKGSFASYFPCRGATT